MDGRFIDDERHSSGFDTHPLIELIQRASVAGAFVNPVTALDRSSEYQSAVTRALAHAFEKIVCIRISQSDVELVDLGVRLATLLKVLGVRPRNVLLMIEFGGYDGFAADDLLEMLVFKLSQFPFRDEWGGFAFSISAFPVRLPKIKPGELRSFPRYDWAFYKSMYEGRHKIGRMPSYSDYCVEHPIFSGENKKITPVAHIRYTSKEYYHVFKGESVKAPAGYQAIHVVAEELVRHADYMGIEFSKGDEVVVDIASRMFTGNAATWRMIAVSHHIEMVNSQIEELFGRTSKRKQTLRDLNEGQFSLF